MLVPSQQGASACCCCCLLKTDAAATAAASAKDQAEKLRRQIGQQGLMKYEITHCSHTQGYMKELHFHAKSRVLMNWSLICQTRT
jgi:hypothetical protein